MLEISIPNTVFIRSYSTDINKIDVIECTTYYPDRQMPLLIPLQNFFWYQSGAVLDD